MREAVDVELGKVALRAVAAGSGQGQKAALAKMRETWGLTPAQIARTQRAERIMFGGTPTEGQDGTGGDAG